MYGYLIAGIVAVFLLGFCIAAFGRGRPGPPKRSPGDAPAADEPTPGRSVTASESEIAAAQRHTPPA